MLDIWVFVMDLLCVLLFLLVNNNNSAHCISHVYSSYMNNPLDQNALINLESGDRLSAELRFHCFLFLLFLFRLHQTMAPPYSLIE